MLEGEELYKAIIIAGFLLLVGLPARGQSTHSFANCGFPATGQTLCYDNSGTPVAGACPFGNAGQDGDYPRCTANLSYTIYRSTDPVVKSSVTVDNRTGLMWITNPRTDAAMGGTYTWTAATAACEASAYAGYTDWRLPNAMELLSIVNYSVAAAPRITAAYFPNTVSNSYWTSTTFMPTPSYARLVFFSDGNINSAGKNTSAYIRCVRAGPSALGLASIHAFNSGMNCGVWYLPDTGQTSCYKTAGTVVSCSGAGVDGSVLGSSPSYTLNGSAPNQTTQDNITGLMWTSDGAGAGCDNGTTPTWTVALSFCEALNFGGYSDWRLPNVRELMSIMNYGASPPPAINAAYFPNTATSNYYWSSTTSMTSYSYAWGVYFGENGSVDPTGKTGISYVRCVRGGL
jgi:hypothetical protein